MLIEQSIEFELRGPGPPGRTCTPITGYLQRCRNGRGGSTALCILVRY